MALGLCTQIDLDATVRKAAEKKAKLQEAVPTAEERVSLMPVAESLITPEPPVPNALPSNVEGFESFSLDDPRADANDGKGAQNFDPDALFNLPRGGGKDDDETEEKR